MSGDVAAGAGVLVAGLSAAFAILAPPSRLRSAAMAAALVLAGLLIVGDGWHRTQIADLRGSPARAAALVAAGGLIVGAAALAIRRRPGLLPLAILASLPFRIPLNSGGDQANLLLPLYLVIAAGVIATGLRDAGETSSLRRSLRETSWLQRALAVFATVYALGVLPSEDFSKGLQNVGFFIVPFSLAFVLLAEERWDARLLRRALYVVAAEALIFALVGFAEYSTRSLLWNETVIRSNDFHVYFRVNSLFWDPNVYGRYLSLVIVALGAALIWSRDRATALLGAAAVAVLWLGLATTFSQSSYASLIAGLAVLAALRWSLRWTLAACLVVLALGAGVALATGAFNRVNIDTSGRANLVSGGLSLYGDRPLAGYGSGSFSRAFREHASDGKAPVSESHAEPVTVAAEQGTIGLLVYAALIGLALLTLSRGMGQLMPGLAGGAAIRGDPPAAAARAAILAALVALLVHTMAYAGFIEDPITWCLLAIGGSLAAIRA